MLYRKKYRIPSIRLKNWDYRSAGYYFVTICTKGRWSEPFGHIENGEMFLSDIGKIASANWFDILKHFSNVILDQFVMMPDHVHGIIRITNNDRRRDAINRVSTETYAKFSGGGITKTYNPMLYQTSLPTIIRWYKGFTTFHIRKQQDILNHFMWQPRYYERIIRTEKELFIVRKYIRDNPKNW